MKMAEYIEYLPVFGAIHDLSMDAFRRNDKKELCCYNKALSILCNAPAAAVAPVVHAKWIVTEQENGCAVWNDYTCSVCGSVFDGKDWLFDEWKGCPVCLARMDGDT